MLHPGEVAKRTTNLVFLDTGDIGSQTGSQRVVYIMTACKTQAFLLHVKRCGILQLVLTLLDVTNDTTLLDVAERALHSLDIVLLQFLRDDGIVSPVDKGILRRLVLDDTHLGIGIVLHLVIVTVQMVRRNVQQNGDVCTEIVHIIELERREFDDVVLMRLFCHLQGQRVTNVSSQSGIVARLTEDMIDERSGCRLTV